MKTVDLKYCLEALDTTVLAQRLTDTLCELPPGTLPLQHGCEQGGMIDDHAISASVLTVERTADHLTARVGVFFTEIVGGCNCNDDPVESNAYCIIEVRIDRATGIAVLSPED
jgi:hypothetical protein